MDMTAYFLGRAAGEGGGGSSVQSDYLQNDPSAKDYIKNRPFYSEITYDRAIVPLQDMKFESESTLPEGCLMTYQQLDIVTSIANGGQYELTIDETTYPIILKNRTDLGAPEYLFFAGNFSFMPNSKEPDTKESYFIMAEIQSERFGLFLAYKSTATTHKVSLSYIGDTVPLILEDEYEFTEYPTNIGTLNRCSFPYGAYYMGLQENDVFNVTFDGKSYTNLSWKTFEGVPYLGNSFIFNYGNDTGEDWLFSMLGNNNSVDFITREAGPHTLSLEKASLPFTEIVHKIDSKYLDVNVEVPYTEDSSGNVTFKGDVKTSNGTSLDAVKSDLEANKPVQADYLQNDSTAKDYIKNRPFYAEKKAIVPITQTIYDSINSDSPNASYDITNDPYVSVIKTDGTFEDYIINGSEIKISQKIITTSKTSNTYFITRTGKARIAGSTIYVGNLYYFTQLDTDNTDEDYLFYYNADTNNLSLYFSVYANTDGGISLVHIKDDLGDVGLVISVYTDHEYIYHKIDPNYLPKMPYTTDTENNTIFEGTITAKDLLIKKEIDGSTVIESLPEVIEKNSPQSDFTQKDSTAKDYIKNKPRIGQDYIILTDIENNSNYIIQMVNGSLASCKIPTSIEVTTNPIKMEYFRGEVFDPTGMVLTAYYGDGTSEIIENYTYFTGELENCGNIDFTITTQIKSVTYKNTVPILVFHLDDFEYTANDDGTYTLTAWKETLNGNTSTEMIVPNSSRIII